jgi:glycosyltransferase involved in cell wall biosynthesis
MPSIPTRSLDTLTHTLLASIDALFRRADIIHYHGVGPATLAWIPRLFRPASKVVVTFHSMDRFHKKWGPVARAYLRFGEWAAVRFPHATIAVSKSIERHCRTAFAAAAEYIPNGAVIKPHPGSDLLATLGLEPGGYILTVARLVRQKGIHYLIEAFDGFEKEKKLVIVGSAESHGEYAEELRRLSEGNTSVVFTGFQSGKALEQLFAGAYLYVHPSESEGLSVSILEAMGAGRCVLVSDIPENVESIDHSGLTFASADVAELRAKLRMLLNHPELVEERGRRGREWVRAEYDWAVIAKRTEALYGRLTELARKEG